MKISSLIRSNILLQGRKNMNNLTMKMRQFFYIVATLIICLFITSCNNRAEKVAKDFCICWKDVADIANLEDTLIAKNLVDSLEIVNLILVDKLEEAKNCSAEKREADDGFQKAAKKPGFKEAAKKLMKKNCPDVFSRVDRLLKNKHKMNNINRSK